MPLKLRLFSAIITPTVLYGMASAPLTNTLVHRINVTERRMIRLIIGWVRVDRSGWPGTMRRMRARIDRVLERFPLQRWTQQIFKRQWELSHRWANMDNEDWTTQAVLWDPTTTYNSEHEPTRRQGRPLRKWDDKLNRFCLEEFGVHRWTIGARRMSKDAWLQHQRRYCEYCEAH